MDNIGRLVLDGFLVAGFGVQHSCLATVRMKSWITRRFGIQPLPWRSFESLVNVVYILIAASLWQHVPLVVWHIQGVASVVLLTLAVCSWLWYWQLHLFEYDCGLAFGSTTLVAYFAGQSLPRLLPWKVGSRRWIRFPVHTAFFGMFLAFPVMTADLLVLGVVINIYNVIGSILYDKRLEHLAGESYRAYQRVTGLILPPIFRAPRGAEALEMAQPQHWHRPIKHLPGLLGGVFLAALYYVTLGNAQTTPLDALRTAGAGLFGAVLIGIILGYVCKPQADDWAQQQTDLSTTIALAAASGVVLWIGAVWWVTGSPPTFAFFLPLWFTVQYLGHLVAFLVAKAKWTRVGEAVSSPRSNISIETP